MDRNKSIFLFFICYPIKYINYPLEKQVGIGILFYRVLLENVDQINS